MGLEVYDVFSNFPDLYQLLIPSWGGGFFRDDTFGNQMSVQIGLANLLVVLLGFIAFFVFSSVFFSSIMSVNVGFSATDSMGFGVPPITSVI